MVLLGHNYTGGRAMQRVLTNYDNLYTKLTLTSGWPIETTSEKLFWKHIGRNGVGMVVGGLTLQIEDIKTMQIETTVFICVTSENQYKWEQV